MAKLLKTAALVVGAVALVATGVGAAAGVGIFGAAAAAGGSIAGIAAAATFTSIGAIAGVAAGVLSLAAGAVAPKGTVGGNQTKFTIDKDSGNPVAIGRTLSGGKVVHRQYHGSKNAFESWVTVHSIGPVKSVGPLLIDKVEQTFAGGGAALGTFAGFMWLATQLGACPEASALPAFNGPVPGWDATSKLSGLAADMWCLKFDDKGKIYPSGVPDRGRVVEGVGVYDPRLDSTFPGGMGPCRIDDATTYILGSENPALHALTWAYGHWQNGTLIAGGGLDINGIDGAPFAEWASVCDANNWKAGGIVYTATDDSWDVLKMIAQAGGGEVMPVSALLSCTFSAPRVSIGAITTADITADVDVPGTASRRLRRNTIIPRVRLESQGWQVVPLEALTIDEYVTVDGGKRPKELDLPLVQQADQGAELGLYDILNARELDGISLPCKIYALGYRPGDCLTIDIPEADLVARTVIVRNRELDTASLSVTLTCRTETAEKHDFALGKTATPPRTPDLSVPIPNGYPVDWEDVYGDGKPEDNATVGAPEGTNVGGLPAKTVVDALAVFAGTDDAATIIDRAHAAVARAGSALSSLLSAQLLGEDRQARIERLTHLDGQQLTTRVVQEITERKEGAAAIVERVDLIEATASDGIAAAQAAISEEASVRASADEAETALRQDAVSTVLADIDGERVLRESEISRVETTSASNLSAATSQLDAAISTVEVAIDDERLQRQAAIVDERTTSADALSAATSQLEAAISTVEVAIGDERLQRQAAITDERHTSADALSSATSQLQSAISAVQLLVDGERQDRQAAITEERNTSANEVGAIASQVLDLGTQVGENQASIMFLLETTNGEHAVAQLSLNVNGQISGFKINGEDRLFAIAADRFVVGNSQIFEVDTVTGETVVNRLKANIVDTGNLKVGAVTDSIRSLTATTFAGQGSAWIEVGRITMTSQYDLTIDIIGNGLQDYGDGLSWGLRILVDGAAVKTFPFASRSGKLDILTIQRAGVALSAGDHIVTLEWAANNISLSAVDFSILQRFA